MLPCHIVAVRVGFRHRNSLSSGWLVAYGRGPVLAVSIGWAEMSCLLVAVLGTAGLSFPRVLSDICYCYMATRAFMLQDLCRKQAASDLLAMSAKPLVSSRVRGGSRERVALLRAISSRLVLCRLVTLRRIASSVVMVQSKPR